MAELNVRVSEHERVRVVCMQRNRISETLREPFGIRLPTLEKQESVKRLIFLCEAEKYSLRMNVHVCGHIVQ